MRLTLNGLPQDFADGLTVQELLRAEAETEHGIIVEVNGQFVSPRDYARRLLGEGDTVEVIIAAIGG